jgi:hypothetical protein
MLPKSKLGCSPSTCGGGSCNSTFHYCERQSKEEINRVAKELHEIWLKAPIGSDVFVLLAEHAYGEWGG